LLDEHQRTHPDGQALSFEEGKALYRKHGADLNAQWEAVNPKPEALKAKPAGTWPDAATWEQKRPKPLVPKAETPEPSATYAGIPMAAIRNMTPEVAKRWEAMLKAGEVKVQPTPPAEAAPQNSQAHHDFLVGLAQDTRKQAVAELKRNPDHAKERVEARSELPMPKFAPTKLANAEPLPEPDLYEQQVSEPRTYPWLPDLVPTYRGPGL